LRVLERSQLPLSFLDPAPTTSSLPATRLFSANLEALEIEDETDTTGTKPSMLLIASLEAESTLYAVERVNSGIFALCKLCSWVKIGYLDDSAMVAYTPISRPVLAEKSDANARMWWQKAAINQQADDSVLSKTSKRARLSMVPPVLPEQKLRPEIPEAPPAEPKVLPAEIQETLAEPQVTGQQVFETLVQQYLGALYKSKSSLAFFAKGPLSRTRAACTTSTLEDLTILSLTSFLRSMLLTMASMDKKYREKLPAMIKEFPHTTLSDFEQEAPTSTKKRKSKKLPRLSRDGTYSIEEDYVKRWWYTEDSRRQDETAEQLMKRKIGDLRVRETLAQVILILEILALEATPEYKAAEAAGKVTEEDTQEIQKLGDADPKKKKRKSKKPADLVILLDLLMDKLSIWQSIENDGPATETQKTNDLSSRDNDGKLQDRDLLASFCIEVVIPL
jgi:DNA replication regulator SLD3